VRRLRFDTLLVLAAGPYAGALRKTVLAFKRGERNAGEPLATFLAERVASRLPADVVLVPVPTVRQRRRERGYDQGIRLAQLCGRASGHEVLVALRQRSGTGQRGRNRAARLRARGRFLCTAPELVDGLSIALVDDVVTTGSTLRDCAATLEACGAIVTTALVVAYA